MLLSKSSNIMQLRKRRFKCVERRGVERVFRPCAEGQGQALAAAIDARLRPARAALREAGGIRALLSMLLRGTRQLPAPNNDAARALCCRALLALASDPVGPGRYCSAYHNLKCS